MCGFVGYSNVREQPALFAQYEGLLKQLRDYEAYPAFGGDTARKIPLLIHEDGQSKWIEAIWWFDGFTDGKVTILGKRTSFNARNLESPYWEKSLQSSRACIVATEIGESKIVGKTKHQYLLTSQQPFLLGALYRKLDNGDYCCAVITRDSHPKMSPYHDKAFPLFLPVQTEFLSEWLSPNVASSFAIEQLLQHPKLFPTLSVRRVKTYKGKQAIGHFTDVLPSDIAQNPDEIHDNVSVQQELF